jgi:hypothetical protein
MYQLPPVPEEKRAIMREVALTYRRETRAGIAAGLSPPEHHERAIEAAYAAYRRLDPDAPKDRLEMSHKANVMIANAINADSRWFWHGPDA